MDSRAPLITSVPVSGAALRTLAAAHPARYPVFFDSAARARWRATACWPANPRAALFRDADGQLERDWHRAIVAGGFLDNLEALVSQRGGTGVPGSPMKSLPFLGGWFVYLGYEMAAEIEPRLQLPTARRAVLRVRAARRELRRPRPRHRPRFSRSREHGDAAAHARLVARSAGGGCSSRRRSTRAPPTLAALDEEPPELFLARVRAAQEHIAAGDIYQANLSRRWRLRLARRARRQPGLRRACAAPTRRRSPPACSCTAWSIFSSSPERLLRITGREISTRPIAGTRARQGSPEQDRRDTAELVAHPEGTRRTRHAHRSRTQRSRPRLRSRQRDGGRIHGHRVLCARASHRLQRARPAARRSLAGRCAARVVSRRHDYRMSRKCVACRSSRRWKARGGAPIPVRWGGWAPMVTRTSTS